MEEAGFIPKPNSITTKASYMPPQYPGVSSVVSRWIDRVPANADMVYFRRETEELEA